MKIKTATVIEKETRRETYGCEFYGETILKGAVRDIKLVEKEFCCDAMGDAWGEAVQWGDDEVYFNTVNAATIVQTACYPSGTVMFHYEIKYCPFCGAKIEIENIETVEA